jgi:transcriptional regulator with XRE-family HTH domain
VEKSIHSHDYAAVLDLLRESREAAGMTQVGLAEALERSQSFVSKVERGETRLDVIQLRTICQVLGTSLPAFIAKLEERLNRRERKGRRG